MGFSNSVQLETAATTAAKGLPEAIAIFKLFGNAVCPPIIAALAAAIVGQNPELEGAVNLPQHQRVVFGSEGVCSSGGGGLKIGSGEERALAERAEAMPISVAHAEAIIIAGFGNSTLSPTEQESNSTLSPTEQESTLDWDVVGLAVSVRLALEAVLPQRRKAILDRLVELPDGTCIPVANLVVALE
jgi:hypothetical protein